MNEHWLFVYGALLLKGLGTTLVILLISAILGFALALVVALARMSRNFLVSRGIPANRMRTISYGKERPVAVCNDISCWSQNRRAVTVLNASS